MWALLVVGANPLFTIYGLGGAHNDLLMICAMMIAVALMLAPDVTPAREAWAAAAIVGGALIKVTVAALLPFMIVAAPRGWRRSSAPSRAARGRRSSPTRSSASTG